MFIVISACKENHLGLYGLSKYATSLRKRKYGMDKIFVVVYMFILLTTIITFNKKS